MANVIVTGGSGFVGSHLVKMLVAKGDKVRVLDLIRPRTDAEWLDEDITDFPVLKRVMKKIDVDIIYHVAAIPDDIGKPLKMMRVNVIGTHNILEVARQCKVKRVVCTSSVSACGFYPPVPFIKPQYLPVDENHPCKSADMYSLTKLLQEELCQTYSRGYNLSTVCLRLSQIIGPGKNWDGFSRQLREGKLVNIPFKIEGDEEVNHFVDVRDVAQAHILAGERETIKGGIFNVAGPQKTTSKEFIGVLRDFASDAEIEFGNWGLSQGGKIYFDLSKSRKKLGYHPKYTLRDSMRYLYESTLPQR